MNTSSVFNTLECIRSAERLDEPHLSRICLELFEQIASMRVEELVALKQSLDIFREDLGSKEPAKKIVRKIDEAVLSRAIVLWKRSARDTGIFALEARETLTGTFGDLTK